MKRSIEEHITILENLKTAIDTGCVDFGGKSIYDCGYQEAIEQLLLEYRNVMEENKTLKNLHINDVEHLENLSKMCILKSTIEEELSQYENRLKSLYERQEYDKIKLLNERIFALKKIIDRREN